EGADGDDVFHASASTRLRRWRRRRNARVSKRETTATNPAMARMAASEPGQSTPAPSPPQKTPKLVSNTPTTYLSVFSGTRPSGPRTTTPTDTTHTTAAAAAPPDGPSLDCVLTKPIPKTPTPTPPSNTPLNAPVNEYQPTRPVDGAAEPASARPLAKAAASSCIGLYPPARR